MERRPDPDQLLAQVQTEEARARKGRLRIFFGASAGVGKTYAMLEAARAVRASGIDVVAGYVEPHGRVETERLLEGLERLPTLAVRYRDITRQEFDLDAALRRHPTIILVDELAHSNLMGGDPAPRHPKRWQDVEELLEADIDVWCTVNVQHLESLNDLVTQITGVRQRETLPDRLFAEADEVELIDLPPDDLLARLRAGKIYVPKEAAHATERFFRRPNLLALRELSLRRVADRVEAAARVSAGAGTSSHRRLAGERVLVAIGPNSQAEQLVRTGKRMADALDAGWTVVYVETPQLLRLSAVERNRRIDLLRLAESLGAETVTLDGHAVAATLSEYAQTRHATRVIVGAPSRTGWRSLLRPSVGSQLVREARGFDVLLVPASAQPAPTIAASTATVDDVRQPIRWRRYIAAALISGVCTAIAFAMYPFFELSNLVMVYLLGVMIAGLRLGRGPSVLTAVASVTLFDFCFVPPRFDLAVTDIQYVVTFSVMLTVAFVIANLMASVRQQTRVAGARERRTALLYAMSRELAATRGLSAMARVAVRHIAEVFQSKAIVLMPDDTGTLRLPLEGALDVSFRGADLAVAQWVFGHGRRAGVGSDTLPAAPGLYVPVGGGRFAGEQGQALAVLAVLPTNPRRVLLPEQRHLLETFAGQLGLALERAQLAEHAEASRVETESERLRNTLLASISHDLRTPLAVIAGAGSTLKEQGAALDEPTRVALAHSIETRALEMSQLISNVLELVRLESGQVSLRLDWESMDDLVGAALHRLKERLADHPVTLHVPADLPAVSVDAALIVQVLVNLLDNAVKYTPPGTCITVSAMADTSELRTRIEDEGPGLPQGDPQRLFDKFQRGNEEGAVVGVGLGLAICRAIVHAHHGDIRALRRTGGGSVFEFALPIGKASP